MSKLVYMNKKSFLRKNWMLIAAIVYVISPLDFIPDVFLPIGFADDLVVLALALIKRYMEHKEENSIEGEIVNEG